MSYFGLLWANLFRKRTRTVLTLASVTIAFLLYGLLRTVTDAFAGGTTVAGADRLVIAAKYSVIDNLPIKQKQQILGLDGVEAVAHQSWFGGVYQDPKNFFPKYPVKPVEYFDMFPELLTDASVVERFQNTRQGAMASRGLAERFGWSVGDMIPIDGDIWTMEDGSRSWAFELVGTYTVKEGDPDPALFLLHYDYFDEAVADYGKGQVGWWTVRIEDTSAAPTIASQIDRMFENSNDPTKTMTEDEYQRQFAKQLGDIGLMMSGILGAVFFTIILLTANTMAQALRERIPELAVLKTLGFSDLTVSSLVLAESLVLCVVGGTIGIGLAWLLEKPLGGPISQFTGVFDVTPQIILSGIAVAAVLGLVVGGVPALNARRLAIVDALRGH